jgi:hypothetical protein
MADRDYEISKRLLGTADVQSMTLRAEFQLVARGALIEAQVHSARRSGDESKSVQAGSPAWPNAGGQEKS